MNVNAKQINSIDYHGRMDNTTALGFFQQMQNIIQPQEVLRTQLASVWTAYTYALSGFDQAYAQVRKWMQTQDIEELDKQRDASLRAFLNTLKAMLATPNAEKLAKVRYVQNIRDKYSLEPEAEYMKETTAIAQMVQEMETNSQCEQALQATGLDEWLGDLKAKNAAFLAKMNERTEAQAGVVKGIVRETRQQTEAAYKDLVRMVNAMSICEVGDGIRYGDIIDSLNAEIEHYRRILAQKGKGDATSHTPTPSGGNGGNTPSGSNTPGGGDTPEPNGGDGGNGGDTPAPTPEPNGGNSGNGGDDEEDYDQ